MSRRRSKLFMRFAIYRFLQVLRGKTNFFTPSCPSWKASWHDNKYWFTALNSGPSLPVSVQSKLRHRSRSWKIIIASATIYNHFNKSSNRRWFSQSCIWTIYNVWAAYYCCCSLKPNWAACVDSRSTKLLWHDGTVNNKRITLTFTLTALQKYLQILEWKHLIMHSQNYSSVKATWFTS